MASSSVSLLSDIAIKLDELQAIVTRLLPSDVPPCAPVTFTLCGLNSKLGKGSKLIWYQWRSQRGAEGAPAPPLWPQTLLHKFLLLTS